MGRKKIYGSKVVAFGDSITKGIGVPEGSKKWTDIITDRFSLELVNSGIGGNNSSQGMERLEQDVIWHKPDFVTICFGMNDHCMLSAGSPRVALNTFKDNIAAMVEAVSRIDAIPLLITPSYIIEGNEKEYYYRRHESSFYISAGGAQVWLDRYIDAVREVASGYNVLMADVRKECEKYDPYEFLRSLKNDESDDGVHPHILGAMVYAKVIGDSLEMKFG